MSCFNGRDVFTSRKWGGRDEWKERAKNWSSRYRMTWVGSRKGWHSGGYLPRNFIQMKIRFRRGLEADEENAAARTRRCAALKYAQKIILLWILQVRLIHDDSWKRKRTKREQQLGKNRFCIIPNAIIFYSDMTKKRYISRMKALMILSAYICGLMRSHNEAA